MKKLKIVNNSPVVLWFTLLCTVVLVLHYATAGLTDSMLFSVYRSSLLSPLTYFRFFGHVLGHGSMEHFLGNMTLFVVIGPMLEEKYGSKDLLIIMLITAFVTGLVHYIFFPGIQLLGASGIVFAFILLASFTKYNDGTIPLTFIIVAIIYLGQQVYDGVFVKDNIANLTHIIGGAVGAFFGAKLNKKTSKQQ